MSRGKNRGEKRAKLNHAGSGVERRRIGDQGEQAAAEYLIRRGFDVLVRNYRCKFGEVDIVAEDGETLVFVEVKLRRSEHAAFAAVDERKQGQICRTAFDFLNRHGMLARPARFDVVAVDRDSLDCIHIENAFESTIEY